MDPLGLVHFGIPEKKCGPYQIPTHRLAGFPFERLGIHSWKAYNLQGSKCVKARGTCTQKTTSMYSAQKNGSKNLARILERRNINTLLISQTLTFFTSFSAARQRKTNNEAEDPYPEMGSWNVSKRLRGIYEPRSINSLYWGQSSHPVVQHPYSRYMQTSTSGLISLSPTRETIGVDRPQARMGQFPGRVSIIHQHPES